MSPWVKGFDGSMFEKDSGHVEEGGELKRFSGEPPMPRRRGGIWGRN